MNQCIDGSCSVQGSSAAGTLMDPSSVAARGCTDGTCGTGGAVAQSRGCPGGSCGSSGGGGSCGAGGGCGSSSSASSCGAGGGCGGSEASGGGKRQGLFARMFGGAKTTTMAVAATELAALQIDYSMYLS